MTKYTILRMKTMIKIQRLNGRQLAHWLRNALIIRRLRLIGGGDFLGFPHPVLGHKNTFFLLLTSLFCLFSSCVKPVDYSLNDEGHPILYGYYQEAHGLESESVDVDSVCRFRTKVDAYTTQHPDSKQTWYYPEIQNCIIHRLLSVGINIDIANGGEWGDTIKVNF